MGVVVFAASSLACGLAPSFGVLVGARCVQAVARPCSSRLRSTCSRTSAGATRSAACLGRGGGARRRDRPGGGRRAHCGARLGVDLPRAGARRARASSSRLAGSSPRPAPTPAGRPSVSANAALLLVAGGLVAALFLVVLLLVDGWDMSPAAAGLVVTVMPVTASSSDAPAALARAVARSRVRRRAPRGRPLRARPASSSRLGVDDSAAAPRRGGAGPDRRRADGARRGPRPDQVVHGGWTLAARHAGVVLGLVLLAPVLTNALEKNRTEAIRAGAAVVLDSRIPPLDKLGVAQDVLSRSTAPMTSGSFPTSGGPCRGGRTTPTGTRCAPACRISSTGR